MENLRPIRLIECLRKLWFGIIYNRISKTWEQIDNLDHAHHGFVPNKGTDSASIHLLNILERAKGSLTNLLMNMYDIKGAFDGPSHTGIQIGLWRLGIPDLISQMINTMEAGSTTVVRTSLTQSILDKEGKPGIQQLTQEVPNAIFTPERGVPQGDTGSPLIWLSEYDILLRALTIQRNRLQDPWDDAINFADTSNLSEAASIQFRSS